MIRIGVSTSRKPRSSRKSRMNLTTLWRSASMSRIGARRRST